MGYIRRSKEGGQGMGKVSKQYQCCSNATRKYRANCQIRESTKQHIQYHQVEEAQNWQELADSKISLSLSSLLKLVLPSLYHGPRKWRWWHLPSTSASRRNWGRRSLPLARTQLFLERRGRGHLGFCTLWLTKSIPQSSVPRPQWGIYRSVVSPCCLARVSYVWPTWHRMGNLSILV